MLETIKQRVFRNLKNYIAPKKVELTAPAKRPVAKTKKRKKTKSQLDGERLILMLKAKAILKRKKEALFRLDRKGYKVSLCRYTNISFQDMSKSSNSLKLEMMKMWRNDELQKKKRWKRLFIYR